MQIQTSSMAGRLLATLAVVAMALGATLPCAGQRHGRFHALNSAPLQWVPSWSTALTAPYGTETLPPGILNNATLRETVHLTLGGDGVRVRLSNLFGESPLVVRGVTVSKPSGAKPDGSIQRRTLKRATFQGSPGVTVAAGSEVLTDPLKLDVDPGSDLVLSLSIADAPRTATLHAGARATEFLLPGDHTSDATMPGAATNTRWYFLSGVEVERRSDAPAVVVAFGDSITDGHGATTDGNDRWPDDLFRRMETEPATGGIAVVNKGIGGNCVLQVCVGPPATERFNRDVLQVTDAKTVLLLEGINDLGALSRMEPQPAPVHAAKLQQLEAAFRSFVTAAHEHGMRAIGGTLTPWIGSEYYHPDAQAEADRVALNTWIRSSGTFDRVIDFDAAVRDPRRPDRMLPAYDSGDHLHPGPAGYQRMADAIDLFLLFNR